MGQCDDSVSERWSVHRTDSRAGKSLFMQVQEAPVTERIRTYQPLESRSGGSRLRLRRANLTIPLPTRETRCSVSREKQPRIIADHSLSGSPIILRRALAAQEAAGREKGV